MRMRISALSSGGSWARPMTSLLRGCRRALPRAARPFIMGDEIAVPDSCVGLLRRRRPEARIEPDRDRKFARKKLRIYKQFGALSRAVLPIRDRVIGPADRSVAAVLQYGAPHPTAL